MRRLYLAACELLEALTDDIRSEQEPMKEGAVSQVEVSGQYEPRENQQYFRDSEWEERSRIGFRSRT